MLYDVENMSHNVSLENLDCILTFSMDYLDFDTDIPLTISFEVDYDEQSGFIEVDEDEIVLAINPKLEGEELVRTVFHELVHAKQILTGQYVPGEGKLPGTWNGVMYTCDYYDLPWEKNAYALEEKMCGEYFGN